MTKRPTLTDKILAHLDAKIADLQATRQHILDARADLERRQQSPKTPRRRKTAGPPGGRMNPHIMWSKLDDALIDHRKIYAAGRVIGKNGPVIALGFYTLGLLWSNKHLTDGFLPEDVILNLAHADNPRSIADALVKAELLEKCQGGWQIHDFDEYNPLAKHIKTKRKRERLRKQEERATKNGNG